MLVPCCIHLAAKLTLEQKSLDVVRSGAMCYDEKGPVICLSEGYLGFHFCL